MGSLYDKGQQFFDNNGDPLAGGFLYFYQTGTSTPLATYSNEALSSANANPYELDQYGRTTAHIFGKRDQEYRVTLKTSAGVTIWTQDNKDANSLTGADANTRILQGFASPLDYGAAGDGSTDDAAAIQAAIDASTGVVDLLGKTYRCDSAITGKSGLTLRNGGIDFSQAASPPNEMIVCRGSRGSAILLTGNYAAGAASFALASVSGMAEGDWLSLYSTALWASGVAKGLLCQIDSIASLTVTPNAPLESGFTTATTAAVKKITMISDVVLENLEITTNPAGSGTGDVLVIDMCENVEVRNVRINGAKGKGVTVRSSVDVRLVDVKVDEDNGAGTGLSIGEGSRDVVVSGGRISRMTTMGIDLGAPMTHAGITRGVTIQGVVIEGCTNGVDTQEADRVKLHDLQIDGIGGSGTGILFSGIRGEIRGCEIQKPGATGINVTESVSGEESQRPRIIVDGCVVVGASSDGILVASAYATVSKCDVSGGAGYAFRATGAATFLRLLHNHLHNDGTTQTAASLSGVAGAVVDGNDVSAGASTKSGLELSACTGTRVVNNYVFGDYGISYTGAETEPQIIGNYITSVTAGLRCTSSSIARMVAGLNIITCTTGQAVLISAFDNELVFAGNYCKRDDDAGVCAQFTSIPDGVAAGNFFNNGTYGVDFSSCGTGFLNDGSAYLGQATGKTNGTVTTGDTDA